MNYDYNSHKVRRASIARLKARLSEYIDAARAGEEIIVTDRDIPVARLCPIPAPVRQDARLSTLLRAGLASPAQCELPSDFWKLPRPRDAMGFTLKALLQEREEDR